MYVAYRFRLYPNKKQQEQINKTLGCCRFVYNHYLAKRIDLYKNEGKNLTFYQCGKDLTNFKNRSEFKWLNEVERCALENSLRDLDSAFTNFFREIKKGNKEYGFPKFKKKNNYKQSYRSNNRWGGTNRLIPTIEIKNNKIKLSKLGWVKFAKSRDFVGKIINSTINKAPSGKYFISICVDTTKEKLPENNNKIGIDLGIKTFGTTSNGEIIENPKFLSKQEKRLKMLSRRLSKKKKGGNNYNKARIKLAKLHEHIKNQRVDFLQKLSTKLINENQVICLEDLNIEDMKQKYNFAKSIEDVALYKFRLILNYKANWYGRTVLYVDRYFPSSQLCNNCGYKNPEIKDLNIREWDCPQCNTYHNRDLNAAINILREGLKQIF
jgi:putative transposase